MLKVLLGGAGVLLVVVAVAVIGTYTFLPGIFERRIAASVQDDYNLAEEPEVTLTNESPPRMLLGEFSGGEIVMRQANFAGLTAETVNIGLSAFDVDIPQSIRSGGLVATGQDTGSLEVVVSEREVQRLASLEGDIEGVTLEDGSVVIRRSPVLLESVRLPLEVAGSLGLSGSDLVFRPQRISVAGVQLPAGTQESLFGQAEASFPLEDVPPGVVLDSVSVEGNRLVITGETRTGLGGN